MNRAGVRTAVILLNFRRPQNLPRILSACLQADHWPDVYVLDNSADDSLGPALAAVLATTPGASGRLFYHANRTNLGSGQRHTLAARLDYDAFASIDDDVFLTSPQIDALFAAFAADTSRVHGIWGERLTVRDGRRYLLNAIHGCEAAVDVVNRVYVFSRMHATNACRILRALGHKDWLALGPGSDIILSFSAARRPMIHDVGPIETCETSGTPGIAFWRDDEFRKRRHLLLKQLVTMRNEALRRRAQAQTAAAPSVTGGDQ